MIVVVPQTVFSFFPRILVIFGFVVLITASHASLSLAQSLPPITPTTGAGNLGTTVSQAGNTYNITGGARPGNGPNLFHSFGEFGVPANNIANFLNDSGLATSNILSRVTGGNPSNIFGTIQTTAFGSANLFLMNPAGIVFGPNATLNVGGSVSFTTADYLRLADGARFSAMPGPQDASISSAPVAAFGFVGSNPGAITVERGQLAVVPGQSLSLVGGNITVQGVAVEEGTVQPVQLSAPGGSINLASVASPGEILAGNLESAPNLNGQSFGALGTIQIIERAALDTSGHDGGAIRIRGGRLIVDDSTISANVTRPALEQPGPAGGGVDIHMTEDVLIQNLAIIETNVTDQASPGVGSGGVRIRADHIEIVGVPDFETLPFTGIRSNVAPMSEGGKSGHIELEATSILMKDLSNLEALTSSVGDSGNIKVTTVQNLETENFGRVATGSEASGNAGNIELSSMQGNMLLNNPFISSQATLSEESASTGGVLSRGNSGNITLNAPNGDILVSQGGAVFNAVDGTTGSLGKIEITARNLTLREGSLISGDNLTPQTPDNITVTLSERLTLEGNSLIATNAWRSAPAADLTVSAPQILITGGSFLATDTFRSGEGGRLALFTDSLQLTGGGQLRSGSRPVPFAPPDAEIPTGAGGTVVVQGPTGPAQSIVIDGVGSGILTDTRGTGPGGNMNLAAQSITVQNGGTVSASTVGSEPSATGGDITISSIQSTTLNNGGSITASSTGPANAGNITINAGSQFLSRDGSVTTQARRASGGNITVQATDSVRLINSQINTSVQGGPATAGGNITIDPAIVTLQNSQILAQANQGQGGNINIIAGTFLADQTSRVDASAREGISGNVNIQSPVSSLSGTLATLPQRPLQVQHLLSQRCAAQVNGQLSSLVVAGRDTLPAEPGGWLMSPLAWVPDETPVRQAHMARRDSSRASRRVQVLAGPLADQLSPSPPLDVPGCGS